MLSARPIHIGRSSLTSSLKRPSIHVWTMFLTQSHVLLLCRSMWTIPPVGTTSETVCRIHAYRRIVYVDTRQVHYLLAAFRNSSSSDRIGTLTSLWKYSSNADHISCTMPLISALALSSFLAFAVSLTTLPPLQSTAAELPHSPVTQGNLEINPTFPANVSSGSSDILKIQCDGDSYGKNLNVASCSNVFNYIDKRVPDRTFADRRTGIPTDILLPWRIYDSM